MGTEDFKHGVVPILLAFALVFSMILVAPLASPGDLIYDPGGENIEVEQGDTFLIRHTLEWNEPEDGAHGITIAWDCYDNKPEENFTFVDNSAYFTTGDYVGESILAEVTWLVVASPDYPGSTRYILSVKCPANKKDPRDGQFNVDITLSASGVGEVPHIPGDHVIPYQSAGIIIVESSMKSWNRDPITIRVLPKLISISPSENNAMPGENVTFTVTVINMDNVTDNYALTVSDNAVPSWDPSLSDNLLENIEPGENKTTTLTVKIPENALPSEEDEITVTATSQSDNTVSDNDPCIAHVAIVHGVEVSILPEENSAKPCTTLKYTVTVTNTGNVDDTYGLTIIDNENWGPTLDDSSLSILFGESQTTTLNVHIPENAIGCTRDNITVTATGTGVENSASCIAHAEIVRGVEVSILPDYQEGLPGKTLEYEVTIRNTCNVDDTFGLTVVDNENWGPTLTKNRLENIGPGENKTTTLTVKIPENALPSEEDEITVTATSQSDNTVSNSASCIAHAITITYHDPIHILGKDNFTQANGVISGSGTLDYPYIIRYWDINAENAHGIWIENTDVYFIIRNCYIHGGEKGNAEGGYDGIFFDNVINGIVDNNVMVNNREGIYLYGSDNNLISNNIFRNNEHHGIHLARVSDNNLVTNNLVENNSSGGIRCSSDNNLIYHNNLVNNGWFQAFDTGNNYWDNGYPSGGNYWGDYAGMDENRGENQDVPGSDGLGDTPYDIPGDNNQDRYPLMNPWPSIRIVVNLTISPSYASGLPGGTLSYTVTITNMGNVVDNYDLAENDDFGWVLNLSGNRFENVMPGGKNTTTLTVTIPENATPCTRDNVTVVVTSQENSDISDNGTSIAHAGRLDVKVSISPLSQDNRPGGKLEYMVEVKNIGDVIDNYKLTVDDDTDWVLTLDNNLLENVLPDVLPDENRTITLSVMIPDDAENCTLDNIIVTATSQKNENVSDNANCIAHALIIYDVEVLVSPPSQENENGGTLTYTVTVANTGNVPDNYTLENTDTMGWPLRLENTSLEVPENENRTTTLTVTIPVDAIGCTEDNVTVTATSTKNTAVSDSNNCIAHVTVVKDVEVYVSPPENSGAPGETLTYTVKVTNKGNVMDSYTLEASDNAGWNPTVPPTPLTIPPNDNKTATLSVIIPEGTAGGTEDEITVKATSSTDLTVSDNATCIARAVVERGVEVSILPPEDSGPPGETLTFTVTVKNTENVEDTYDLVASDNADWDPTVSPTSLTIPPNSDETATLTVIIPDEASSGEEDEITVTATSTDPTVSNNATCIARAVVVRDVEVSISPPENSGAPGENVTFTVIIINTGNVDDMYNLEVSDNADPSWDPTVSPTSLRILAGDNNTATVSVTIPEGTASGIEDEITVKATSNTDNTVSDNATCIASAAIMMGVKVSISPEDNSGAPGETLTYTVTVKNTGNVEDNYDLTENDNTNWSLTLPGTLTDVIPGESRTVNLGVGIPDDAENSTRDNVTVTVTSRADNTVKDSASCTAHAVVPPPEHGVQVSISPQDQRGSLKETLTFTVTVKNTGDADDSYDLTVSDYEGWGAILAQNLLTIPAGENRTTTVSVTVPSDAAEDELTHINVIATSRADPTVSDSITSRAIAEGVPEGIEVEFVLLVTSAFLIGAAILVPAYLLRGRPKKAARGRVLRDVSFGFRGRPKKAARRRVLRDVSSGFR